MFGAFKRALKAGATEVRAEYAENRDYLEAVCASSALVANADGDIGDTEKTKAITVVSNHPTLSKLYQRQDIENCLDTMFKRAKDSSGRQQLARELDDIKGRPDGARMAEDANRRVLRGQPVLPASPPEALAANPLLRRRPNPHRRRPCGRRNCH